MFWYRPFGKKSVKEPKIMIWIKKIEW